MRMYQIGIGLIRSTTHLDQRGARILGAKRLDVNPDGSRSLRIRGERHQRRLHRFSQYLFVRRSTDHKNRWVALDVDSDVGPVNLWMHSLFIDVSVSINEKLVFPPTSMYSYRAYLETLLRYGPAAKVLQLTGVVWNKDTLGFMDSKVKKKTKDSEKD